MDHEMRRFRSCVQGNHQDYARAYFGREADELGSYELRIVCSCVCHRQEAFWQPQRAQTGLFDAHPSCPSPREES